MMLTRIRDLPLGDKLVVVGVASSALALVVASLIFLFSNYYTLRAGVREHLRQEGAIVAVNASPAVALRNAETASEIVNALRNGQDVDAACLYDESGALFAHYAAPSTSKTCPAQPPPDDEGLAAGLEFVHPVTMRDRRVGTLYLAGNYSAMRRRMIDQVIAATAAIGLGVLAAVLLSRRVQGIISEPLRELSATASRISRVGDYSLRATKQGNDEIGQLVDTFNTMVSEVERRDEQLRNASRLKDEFLAALSHELRTPLNAVLGWIQVLRSTPADALTTARAHESIERNARAQASLIEDLLDISRIVSGKLHVKSEPVELVGVLEASLEVVRPTIEAKDITVVRRLPPAPQIVIGDAQRLQQIVWNLLSNAVKFTSKGGRVEIALEIDGDSYAVTVRDDGIGIDPEFLPHVFDRFRQADGSITRRHGGLGLGLAIARELTELHGGRLQAASNGSSRGSVFTLVLPRPAERPEARRAAVPPTSGRVEGLRLLVVDDDRDTRDLATVVLTSAGADVETVASAEDALRVLGARRFDVLLCDLAMPGIDGFELMRLIRENAHMPHSATPAIAVSAHAGSVVEARARASGFNAFVAKPYNLEALLSAVRRALSTGAVTS